MITPPKVVNMRQDSRKLGKLLGKWKQGSGDI